MAYRKNDIQTTTTANGDLSGTFGSTTVSKLNGVTVTGTPAAGQALLSTSTTAASWAVVPAFGSWIPADNNLKAANMIPETASSSVAPSASTNYVFRLRATTSITATNVVLFVGTAGATLSGWYVALFDSAGNLIANTASSDQSTKFTSSSAVSVALPLGAATALAAGTYHVSLSTGTATTAPLLQRGASNTGNLNLASGTASSTSPRFGTAANTWTGATPPSTLGVITTNTISFFCGIS